MTEEKIFIGTHEVLDELKEVAFKVLKELPKDKYQAAAALAWIIREFEKETGIEISTVKVWTE